MAKKVEDTSSSRKKSPMVYLYGSTNSEYVWYRFDVESLRLHSRIDRKKPKTECSKCYAMTIRPHPEPMQLSSFAWITDEERGGSWTIVGKYIYLVGGFNFPEGQMSRNLLKLNAKYPSSGWKITSSSRNLARIMPFVALIGRKLYVLGGDDRGMEPRDTKNYWGEIYDLDTKKWKVLELDIESTFGDYIGSNCVVVEKEGEPTRIVLFPSFDNWGRLLFYNVTTGEFLIEEHPFLQFGTYGVVVNNSTLYWFTSDLYLHGYDLVEKRALRSRCLKRQLWTIPLQHCWCGDDPETILIDLCNGKFLLIVNRVGPAHPVAILDVVKQKDSLNVSVESLHTLLFDDPSFHPNSGMVMQV